MGVHFFSYQEDLIKNNTTMIKGTKETLPIIIQAIEQAIKTLAK
jgi:hypothetical protein